jgi:hypothetical protein
MKWSNQMQTDLKIKNDRPDGASIRIQAWDGKLPTYDSEEQRAKAAEAAKAVDIDAPVENPAPSEPVEALPENYKKLNKAELVALLVFRKEAGHEVVLDEADTMPILREKIEATYPAPSEPVEGAAEAGEKESPVINPQYSFQAANLLQESVLSVGQEKVFSVTSGLFLTIKIDE